MTDGNSTEDNNMNPAGLTDVELSASEKGWVPEDQWEGEADQWRPAKEFLDRGELMDRISSQTRQLQKQTTEVEELKTGLKALAEHNKKIAEQEYKKALEDLKHQKAEALDLGDHRSVVDIDEKMSDLKQSKKEIEEEEASPQPSQDNQIHPEVSAWMDKNSWYNTDIILQGAADAIAKQYISANPAAENSPGQVLDYVRQQVLKEFPDRFSTGNRRPSATTDTASNGSTSPRGKKGKYTTKHLDPEQQKIMKSFVSTGVMTEQDYIDQLVALGELG